MIKEGVLNGTLVLSEEFGRYVDAWNGIPVTLGHPRIDGQNVSANSPEIESVLTIGKVFNVHLEGDTLKGEVWIDIERARLMGGDALVVIERMQDGKVMENSTAYFSDIEPEEGNRFGESFEGIIRNIRPDHLAILLNDEGACSVKDGCGLPRANCDCAQPESKQKVNETKEEIDVSMQEEIAEAFKPVGVMIANAVKGIRPMSKEKLIEALAANEAVKFDAETLEGWEPDQLQALADSMEAAAEGDDPDEEEEAEAEAEEEAEGEPEANAEEDEAEDEEDEKAPAWATALGEKVDKLGDRIGTVEANQRKAADEEKNEYVQALVANEDCTIPEKELGKMSIETLGKLADSFLPADMTGVRFPSRKDDGVPEAPVIAFTKEQAGWARQ
jgi:hypothetical protein